MQTRKPLKNYQVWINKVRRCAGLAATAQQELIENIGVCISELVKEINRLKAEIKELKDKELLAKILAKKAKKK